MREATAGANVRSMSETTPSERPYDPAEDQDADPESLEPRTGAQASGQPVEGDPDADPDMLNPRADEQD
jgi:hypothetical protein